MNSLVPPRRVAIIVDSAASVPEEFRESPLTFVAPMRLHVGDKTYRDGVDISSGDFYQRQRRTAARISTSAPSPSDFLEAYESAIESCGVRTHGPGIRRIQRGKEVGRYGLRALQGRASRIRDTQH